MNILDKITIFIDGREVNKLREELAICKTIIQKQEKIIAEQIKQIGNANLRVSFTTNANLELKRVCCKNGINTEGIFA